ncbi:hypothetical protein AKJ09_06387 [Labilithrix luteola]|uniref:Uncharacterized protein n=1 Tax=Labilithrix luteola TaxID=1391654 RepID=A0A0K1Q1S8_9BACT|nr:hypothetical protein AKJ09_06387 [Labilithrix luteola]
MPDPEGLLLVGRIANPDGMIKTAGNWTHLPLPSGAELVRSITDASLGEVVDLSQPLDAAVAVGGRKMSPRPLVAVSVAVRSLEGAKAKLAKEHKLVDGPNGSTFVQGVSLGKSSGEDGEADDDDAEGCLLSPAPVGARLVCGERHAVDALAPYLARTMTRQKWPADVHLELRFGPVRDTVNMARSQLPILARTLLGANSPAIHNLLDGAVGEAADFVSDANRMTLDMNVGDKGVETTSRIDYAHATSLLAKLAVSERNQDGPPPPAFLHLPGETDLAFYGRGADPKLFDHPRELLGAAFVEAAGDSGMPESEKKALKELVADRMLTVFTGASVYGKGYDAAAVAKALSARQSVKPDNLAAEDEATRVLAEQVVGWHLTQVSDPIAKVGPVLKDWSALWNRPAFAKWAKKQASSKMLAQMRIAPMPAGVTLPKESVHLEIVVPRTDIEVPPPAPSRAGAKAPAAKKVTRKPVTMHVFAIPDQGATWIGFGLDGKLVAQKAAASLSTAPATDTLGEKTAMVESLRSSKTTGAALVTLRGLLVFGALGGSERSPFSSLAMLPSKGATPITLTSTVEGPTPSAAEGASVATIKVPRSTIDDLVKLFMLELSR